MNASRMFRRTLLATLAVAALAAQADAQEDVFRRVTVTGRVVDGGSGQGLAGARLKLGTSGPEVSTDASGAFRFDRVTVGGRTLTVYRIGYMDATVEVQVADAMEPIVVPLDPNPIVLEGLRVNLDVFEQRRNATPVAVRVLEAEDMVYSAAPTAADLLADRGIRAVRCSARFGECIATRGRLEPLEVFVDEQVAVGGTNQLRVLRPHEVYMIEIFRGGRQVRVYTNAFMEREAKRGFRPFPVFL